MLRRKFLWLSLAAVLALAALHPVLLAAAGSFLVRAEPPVSADAILVVAGDAWGYRIRKGAELARQGFAPRVFVSGPAGMYGTYESDLAIAFAVREGYPSSLFVPLPHDALSTREEARMTAAALRKHGVRSLILVTSDYHTRRAGALFRAAAPEMRMVVVAAPDKFFSAGRWWKTRQGQKCFFFEATKTVAGWFGI
ncbi:MAG: YdcF family protein [Acidobacteria bacterium]|nr:YdcF family protein [Acidobacteriota bacterium]